MKRYRRILGAALVTSLAGAGLALALEPPLEPPAGDPDVVELLSGMNYVPGRPSIDSLLGSAAVEELIAIAEDESVGSDPGLRIRALRALGQYNQTASEVAASASVRRAIENFRRSNQGTDLLYLRASMLSLARLEAVNAVSDLTGLLAHQSRDIRAACAQALGITGSISAIQPLRDRALVEGEPQVQLAIADALFLLGSAE